MYEIGTVDFYDNNKRFFGKVIPNLAPDKRIKFNGNSIKTEDYIPQKGDTVVFYAPNGSYATKIFSLSQSPFHELDLNEQSFKQFIACDIPQSLKATAARLYENFSENQKRLFLQVLSQNEINCSDYFDSKAFGRSIYETLKDDSFLRTHSELQIDAAKVTSGGAERYKELKDTGIIQDYADSNIESALGFAAGNNEAISRVLDLLGIPDHRKFHILNGYEELSESQLCMNYGRKYIEELFKQMDFAVFDLETKGDKIVQAGLVSNSGQEFSAGNKLDELPGSKMQEFCNLLGKHKTIAGHNIKGYDLGILENAGFRPKNQAIWDTYEMQAAMSPFSTVLRLYNPKEAHNALPDAKTAAGLMKAQIIELACQKTQPDRLPLDEKSKAMYKSIMETFDENDALRKTLHAENDTATYFRRNEEETARDDVPDVEKGNIIIASKRHWADILKANPGVTFAGSNGFQTLSQAKIKKWNAQGLAAILKDSLLKNKNKSINEATLHHAAKAIAQEKLQDFYRAPTLQGAPVCTDLQGFQKINDRTRKAAKNILLYDEDTLEEKSFFSYGPLDAASLPEEITNIGPWPHHKEISETQYKEIVGCDPDKDHEGLWVDRIQQSGRTVYYIRQAIPYEKIKDELQQTYEDKLSEIDIKTAKSDPPVIALGITEDVNANGDSDETTPVLSPTARTRAAFWAQQAALIIKGSEKQKKKAIWVAQDDLPEKPLKGIFMDNGIFFLGGNYDLKRKLEILSSHNDTRAVVSTTQKELLRLHPSDIPSGTDIIIGNTGYEKDLLMLSSPGKETDTVKAKAALRSSRRLARIKTAFPSCTVLTTDPRADLLPEAKNLTQRRQDIRKEWKEIYEILKKEVFDNPQTPHPLDTGQMTTEEAMETMREEKNKTIPGFQWRDAQKEALPHILSKQRNNLITMPTGSGKSILFQAPALFRSSVTHKLSLVISPLKALQKDQVASLSSRDVDFLNSDMTDSQRKLSYMRIRGGETLLLYMTPEAFRSRPLMNALLHRAAHDGGLEYIIFDEAHCISQWGLDFRPDYRYAASRAVKIRKAYPNTAIELFTATMTTAVKNDIRSIVEFSEITISGTTALRHDISLNFEKVQSAGKHDNEKRAENILENIKERNFDSARSSAIIFTRTRRQAEEIAQILSSRLQQDKDMRNLSEAVSYFHGGMTTEERDDVYFKFRGAESYRREYSILVATKAFGMGMDIPDIHYVYHAFPPDSIEDYLQETGRAGRDKKSIPESLMRGERPELPALCLYSDEDHLKVADLQDKESLSWNDIENIWQTLRKYARNAEKDPAGFISVPYNLWERDDSDRTPADNEADFKNGLHWLEQAGKVETSYRTSAYIDIEKLKADNTNLADKNIVKEFADKLRKKRADSIFQLDISATAKQYGARWRDILQTLLEMEKANEIRVTSKTPFQMSAKYRKEKKALTDTKFSERTEKIFAVTQEAIDLISFIETTEDGIKEIICSSDYQTADKPREKNETTSRARAAVRLLARTDGVQNGFRDGKRTLKVTDADSASKNLHETRAQALRLLNYLEGISNGTYCDQDAENQYTDRQAFVWTTAARKCSFTSYSETSRALETLQILGYVSAGRLLQGGVRIKIHENGSPSKYEKAKADFKEAVKMKRLRLISMAILPQIDKGKRETAIEEYFQQSDAAHLAAWLSSLQEKNYLKKTSTTAGQTDTVRTMLEQYRGEAYTKQLEMLDDEQKAAVSLAKDKDAIVFAGPGSGKTRVLTMRCAYLIREYGIREKNLLVLAYNRQTAEELRRRLKVLFMELGYSERRTSAIQTYTFHSYIKRMAKLASGEEYTTIIGDDIDNWENNFSDSLNDETTRQLLASAIRRERYCAEFILVDEFQDINENRLNILKKLNEILSVTHGGKRPRFFVIGDNDQSIYGYQREKSMSAVPLVNEFSEYLKDSLARTAPLRRNYRSSQTILDYAERIIGRKKGALKAANKEVSALKDNIEEIRFENLLTSKEYKETVETALQKGIREIAFLLRTNQEMERFYSQIVNETQFNAEKTIKLFIYSDSEEKFFRTRECYQLINKLKTENNEKISEKDINNILGWSNKRTESGVLDPEAIELTNSVFLAALDRSESKSGQDTASLMEEIASEPMSKLLKLIPLFRENTRKATTNEEIRITLMTIHKAKGLEFDSVVIAPSMMTIRDNDKSIKEECEEERRILFVASTRAKKYLRIYRNTRTDAILGNQSYHPEIQETGSKIDASKKLTNYNLSFVPDEKTIFSIKKGDTVKIEIHEGKVFIYKENKCIGQLSREAANSIKNDNRQTFHVNDIYVWRKTDAENSDKKNNTNYANNWKNPSNYIWITTII